MIRPVLRRRLLRAFADFALGLVLFSALMGSLSVPQSGAFPAPPPSELISIEDRKFADRLPGSVTADAIAFKSAAARTDKAADRQPVHLAILALVLAALTAINLWIFRHLRVAYAAERRKKSGKNV